MKLKAAGNTLELLEYERITSESTGINEAFFEFDRTWDGFMSTAVFKTPNLTRSAVLDDNNSCKIPGEALASPGPLSIAVFGIAKAGTVITTNYVTHGMIIKGADVVAAAGQEPTPTLYSQIMEKLGGILEQLEAI